MKDASPALGTCTHIYSVEGKIVAREIPWLLSHPGGPSSRPLKVYVVPRATSVPSTILSEGLGPYTLGILRCLQYCPDSDFKTLSPPHIAVKLCVGNSSTRCLFVKCRKALRCCCWMECYLVFMARGAWDGRRASCPGRGLGLQTDIMLDTFRAGASCLSLFLPSCYGQQCVSLRAKAFSVTLPSPCLPWPGIW